MAGRRVCKERRFQLGIEFIAGAHRLCTFALLARAKNKGRDRVEIEPAVVGIQGG